MYIYAYCHLLSIKCLEERAKNMHLYSLFSVTHNDFIPDPH